MSVFENVSFIVRVFVKLIVLFPVCQMYSLVLETN